MDRGIEGQIEARTLMRRAREDVVSILDHLKYLTARVDTFDYNFSTPSDIFEIKVEAEKITELEKRLHEIRVGLGG